MLNVKNLSVRYGTHSIVEDVSFSVAEGQWMMVVGPNGAGKSTIVNAVTQTVDYSGTIEIMGKDIKSITPVERARLVGILAQTNYVGYHFTVEEIVQLGRYSYAPSIFSRKAKSDEDAVTQALELTGMSNLRKQSILKLSGGEIQRVFLAQVFAQDPKLLILDEPTNHLDLVYQKQVFSLISQWLKTPGRAVVSVVHDLSLAKAYGSDALLLSHGTIAAKGDVKDVLDAKVLSPIYQLDVADWMKMLLSQW